MAHIRLDDKRIELSTGKPWIGTGDEAQVRLDADQERGILAIIMAGRQGEAPMLATLEVVPEGVVEGSVHPLRAPLAHIGHGRHSDDVVVDDRCSGARAGIQRRESDWFVADMDSTNKTCLSGERVPGDRALNPDTAVRFGGAKVIFRSEPEIVDADGETVLLVIQDC